MVHNTDDLLNKKFDSTKFVENEVKRNIELLSVPRGWSIRTIGKHMPDLDIKMLRSIFDPSTALERYSRWKQELSETDYREFIKK